MPPFKPQFTITSRILNSLMAIERAKAFLELANLSPQWLRKTNQAAWLTEAHHTTHIEGTQLTLEESKRILLGKKLPHANPNDVKEVLNYKDALDLMLSTKQKNITETLIKKIHKQLVKGVRGGQAKPGRYRNTQNYVGNAVTKQIVYMPPKPQQVPALMQQFVEWINTKHTLHPVLKSGVIQFQLVQIHPFADGNGRTSRLLCALYLHQSGYSFKNLFSISQYYDTNRQKFYAALQSVREQKMDMTDWLEYFSRGLETQIDRVVQMGKMTLQKGHLIKNKVVSIRQALILNYLEENESLEPKNFKFLSRYIQVQAVNSKYKSSKLDTPKAIAAPTLRTLQRDLADLVDKKIIRTTGRTNRKTYSLKPLDKIDDDGGLEPPAKGSR